MSSILIKNKVLREIELIPEDRLADLYNFIHYFRLGLEKSQVEKSKSTMAFAGSWKDMSEEIFVDFAAEISERRRRAFSERRKE